MITPVGVELESSVQDQSVDREGAGLINDAHASVSSTAAALAALATVSMLISNSDNMRGIKSREYFATQFSLLKSSGLGFAENVIVLMAVERRTVRA